MLKNRETLSPMLFGLSALTIATGMPAIHDSTTAISAISAVSGPLRAIISATLSERKNERPKLPRHDVAEPAEILHDQRVAEPELRHVAGAIGLAELGKALGSEDRDERIAGQDAQHHEHDDRHADNGQRPERQPTDDIGVHDRPVPPSLFPPERETAVRRPSAVKAAR